MGLIVQTYHVYFAITLVSRLATAVNQFFYSSFKPVTFQKIHEE